MKVSCVKGQWEVKGDPRCKGASSGSSKNKNLAHFLDPKLEIRFNDLSHGLEVAVVILLGHLRLKTGFA